jgi:8-oxo-dGTP diphosphatase
MVLALKRPSNDKSRPGCWDLPGGGYEQGEEVISSIKREAQEEVSLLINNPFPVFFANKINTEAGLYWGRQVFAICYACRDWKGLPAEASAKEGEITLSDEHTEFKWVTPKQFLKLNFGNDGGFFVASMQAYLSFPLQFDIFKK